MEIESRHRIALVVVLGIVALVVMAVVAARRQQRATRQVWNPFASQHRLTYPPPEKSGDRPRIEGQFRGRVFSMSEVTISRGSESEQVVFRMHLSPRDMPEGLAAYERMSGPLARAMEGITLGVGNMLGGRIPDEVESGHPAFDQKWTVLGFDAEAVRAWLASQTRREALVQVCSGKERCVIDNAIRWEGRTPTTMQKIEELVADLEGHAKRFEDA